MVWLLILIAPVLGSVNDAQDSGGHVTVVVTLCSIFAVVYFVFGVVPDEWEEMLPLAIRVSVTSFYLATLTFLAVYDSPSWAYYFVYTVFPLVSVVRRPWPTLSSLVAVAGLVGGVAGGNVGSAVGPIAVVGGVGVSFLSFSRLSAANRALRQARDDQARVAVAEERLRFARDLHDLLGHSLSVITLKSEVAGRLLPASPDRAAQEVAEIEAVAREALREVREAVSGYRRASLAVELAGARSALAAAGIAWEEEAAPADLPQEVDSSLAWALREGVTNVIRHSGARRCRIAVRVEREDAVLVVTDDGPGVAGADELVPDEPGVAEAEVLFGNGLHGLEERLALSGGALRAGPAAGGGFCLQATVPLAVPAVPCPLDEPGAAARADSRGVPSAAALARARRPRL